MVDRLSLSTLSRTGRTVLRPAASGVVHLGVGAFSRAHGFVFTQHAMDATGDDRWGYCAVTQRSRSVIDQLDPQDGLYSVLVRSGDRSQLVVVGAVRELLFPAEQGAELTARLAAPSTSVVTLTVTEKGYRHDPATRRLRTDDPDVVADASGRPDPVTVVGRLVRGLAARRAADAGPLTVLSCDNLPANGEVLRGLVNDFCALSGDSGLAAWIGEQVRFPSSMVDRIVPATTDDDRAEVTRLIGLVDEGAVVTEPFSQWVVEDSFAGPRPAWERVGVTLTDDVAPYEAMKLRLLNGSHSTLAYLGLLAGHEFVYEAVGDDAIAGVVRRLMDDDVTPSLVVPQGFSLEAYKQQLFERWANTAIRHRLTQIAMDGTQKIPNRWLGPIRERLAAGAEPLATTLGLAAWMRWVVTAPTLDDPLADRLREALGGADEPGAVVDRLLGVREMFGDLGDSDAVRGLLVRHLRTLTEHGVEAACREVTE